MLVLSRKVGETLYIGDGISVTIIGIKRHQVRIGIQAPKSVPVHREEVYERIKSQKGSGGLVQPGYLKSPRPD